MKLYSLITICITLGLFYALAVFEQNKKANEKRSESNFKKINTFHHNLACTRSFTLNEASFDMIVTGKEHRYLNTGITSLDRETEYDDESDNLNSFLVANDD